MPRLVVLRGVIEAVWIRRSVVTMLRLMYVIEGDERGKVATHLPLPTPSSPEQLASALSASRAGMCPRILYRQRL